MGVALYLHRQVPLRAHRKLPAQLNFVPSRRKRMVQESHLGASREPVFFLRKLGLECAGGANRQRGHRLRHVPIWQEARGDVPGRGAVLSLIHI